MASIDDSPHAAAYGLACEACARAKCKCVVQPGGRCERYVESRSIIYLSMQLTCSQYSCDRLDKICQPTKSKRQLKTSDGVRSSRVEKSRSDVDVSRLERKLDQLVAQLKGQQQSLASPANSDASSLIPSPVHVCCHWCRYIVDVQPFGKLIIKSNSSPMTSHQQKPKTASCGSGDTMRNSSHTSACLVVRESYNETDPLFGRVSWRYPLDSGRSSTNE